MGAQDPPVDVDKDRQDGLGSHLELQAQLSQNPWTALTCWAQTEHAQNIIPDIKNQGITPLELAASPVWKSWLAFLRDVQHPAAFPPSLLGRVSCSPGTARRRAGWHRARQDAGRSSQRCKAGNTIPKPDKGQGEVCNTWD